MLNKPRSLALFLVGALIFSTLASNVSNAVQFGTESPGNTYVVPIHNNSSNTNCSGALIASVIVATAAHCVLDLDNNYIVDPSNIFVGAPGSRFSFEYSLMTKALKIDITPNFKSANNKSGADDIAFITLSSPMEFDSKVRLASESEITTMKNSSQELRVTGYGVMNEQGDGVRSYTPQYFTGNYGSELWRESANKFSVRSQVGSACVGDSGAPVVAYTPDAVIIVGIATGSFLYGNKYCAGKESSGYYITQSILINRYSNLFFTATINHMQYLEQKITELQAKLPKTIVCVKSKIKKKVTGKSRKCPKGYKATSV
jgi:secreted trypsin-like serine protease